MPAALRGAMSRATAPYDRMAQHQVSLVGSLRDAGFDFRCFAFADADGNLIDVGEVI